MTDAKANLLRLTGVEVHLDQVRIPHQVGLGVQMALMVPLQLLLLMPLIAWQNGSIAAWHFAAFLLWVSLVAVVATLKSRISVRPGLLAVERSLVGRVVNRREVPLQMIRKVEILEPSNVDILQGSLMLHLSDGDSLRVFPCGNSHDADVVGTWLQEVVARQDTVEPGSDPVPEELKRLRRGHDRVTEK